VFGLEIVAICYHVDVGVEKPLINKVALEE
jgi:hypothetical protein